MNAPRGANPLLLVFLTVLLLSILSLFNDHFARLNPEIRPVELLADVVRPAAPAPAPVARRASPPPAADSTRHELASFLEALRQTRQRGTKTRIAYFGDSMIEGDLITGELRHRLQLAFGGQGVGFVPIESVAAGFRQTIYETSSEDWTAYNLVSPRIPAAHPLGLAGHVFIPQATGASWVRYVASPRIQELRRFAKVRLFYGPGHGQDKLVLEMGARQVATPLAGTALLNQAVVQADSGTRDIKATFNCRGARSVYGFSFEGAAGVTLDNFSFRGNSGLGLRRVSPAMLAAFAQYQDYRLIVLHYGANVADRRLTNYHGYEQAMVRVVGHLREAFPQASILIIGMSDKSIRQAGRYVTDPSVPLLLAAQQRLASRTHAGFWNLYEAMGGENSMPTWVEAQPALANRDYTHVTQAGGRKIGSLLYAYLMQQYAAAARAR